MSWANPLPDPSKPLPEFEGMAQHIAQEPPGGGTDVIVGKDRWISRAIARRIAWLKEQS